MPAPASDHQRLLAASLAGLTDWERNFLRLLSHAGAQVVIVELGSMRDRPREAAHYGRIGTAAEVAAVRAAIATKLRRRAAELAAAPPSTSTSEAEESAARDAPPPHEGGLVTAPEQPAAGDESRAPAPNGDRRAPSSPPAGGDGNAADPEDAGPSSGSFEQLDDFGAPRPGPIGAQRWQPREPVPCATCDRRFWPTGPGARFCRDHKDPRNRPADEPEAVCDVCDHVLPELGAPCSYCARELADVAAILIEPPAAPTIAPTGRDPLTESVLALLVADATRLREEFAPRLVALEQQVAALTGSLDQLRGMVDASGLDALDITLGAAVAGLARIGRGELPAGMTTGQLLLNLSEEPAP